MTGSTPLSSGSGGGGSSPSTTSLLGGGSTGGLLGGPAGGGSGPSGPYGSSGPLGSTGPFGSSGPYGLGSSGGGYYGGFGGFGPAGGPGLSGSGGGFFSGFSGVAGSHLLATTAGIRAALAPFIGCFDGLPRSELTVLNLRAGFDGQLPHTRRQAATRLGTSPRQIRLTEQRALQRPNGLAQTQGCAGTTEFIGGVTVVNGFIGPAEIAVDRTLVAFGSPAYQGFEQSRFSRLGQLSPFGSPAPLPARFGAGSSGGSAWAIQLLVVMLLVAFVGFRRLVPLAGARLRGRRLPGPSEATIEYLEGAQEEELEPELVEPPAEPRREKIAA